MRVSQVSKYPANWWDCSNTYCSPSTSVHHLLWNAHPPFQKSRLCRHRPRWLQSQELTWRVQRSIWVVWNHTISYSETIKATLTIKLYKLWSVLRLSNHEVEELQSFILFARQRVVVLVDPTLGGVGHCTWTKHTKKKIPGCNCNAVTCREFCSLYITCILQDLPGFCKLRCWCVIMVSFSQN